MSILNSCNKPVYQVSDIDRLKRFLTLGSENGTFYINPIELTCQNVTCIDRLLQNEETRYQILACISNVVKNKTKKQDPIVHALAQCCTFDLKTLDYGIMKFRRDAYDLVNQVCYTPTILFLFINKCKLLCKKLYNSSGWNNLHKNAIINWYTSKAPDTLLYQITKYGSRHRYTHRDVLRLTHMKPCDTTNIIFKYILGKDWTSTVETNTNASTVETNTNASTVETNTNASTVETSTTLETNTTNTRAKLVDFITDIEKCKKDMTITSDEELIGYIHKWKLSKEHIPNNRLNPAVYGALLPYMSSIAILRNLNMLTMHNVLSETNVKICKDKIQAISVHPMYVLVALKTYAQGQGYLSNKHWSPNQDIVDALDEKYYDLFKECKTTNKRICIAMDVSGSMQVNKVYGADCMNAAEACCALAMVIKATNENTDIMGFSSGIIPLNISPRKRLDDNLTSIRNLPFSDTDISLPFVHAVKSNKHYDTFIVLTDNETNSNRINPYDALVDYRNKMNIPDCKLIVVAAAANGFTIANPEDKYMLDIAGFDASVPDAIAEFIES